jgi:peptidoglycan/LPS O-acetylase OafA/YrhL
MEGNRPREGQRWERIAGRIPELDGVRGFAILLVLVWHYLQGQIAADSGRHLLLLKQTLGFTWSGVDLFFVLSGFLITGILVDNREKQGYFRTFYIRRVCRIFPLYYLNLALFTVLSGLALYQTPPLARLLEVTPVPEWTYWVYLQNLYMGANNSFGPEWLAVTWSLAVEEQFYLLLPLVIRFIPVSLQAYVFTWFAATAVYLRYELPGFTAYINTPWRADSLMAGALLALLVRNPRFVRYVTTPAGRHMVYGLFGLLLAGALLTNLSTQRPFSLTFTYLWLAGLYASLILVLLLDANGWMARIFRTPRLMWLGGISYGVYLIHQPVSGILHGLRGNTIPVMRSQGDVAVTLSALLVTLLLAHVSYQYFEKRIIRLGHRHRYT